MLTASYRLKVVLGGKSGVFDIGPVRAINGNEMKATRQRDLTILTMSSPDAGQRSKSEIPLRRLLMTHLFVGYLMLYSVLLFAQGVRAKKLPKFTA